ncbi:flavin reductase family protein [Desulfoferula mesophila]|uniref:Flavin reductase like domain-containing protein n=1 Tax=Desulfoferula mesophila TaxID=3058419 RepID=A0AAU9F190_9BACT|nr:hypothetical protein FAK_30090 [Desulfoferula mesophilus]
MEQETAQYTVTGRKVTDIDRAFEAQVKGVVVLTSRLDERLTGMTASWFTRAAEQPFLAVACVYKENFSHGIIRQSKALAVNFLGEGQQDLARCFGRQSSRQVDKFAGLEFFTGRNGCPVLAEAAAYLECRLVDEMDARDHTVFLCEALAGRVLRSTRGLVYDRRDYLPGQG